MTTPVESTTRTPVDFVFFGLAFWGTIITIASVLTVHACATVCGVIAVTIAMAYFAIVD